MSGQQYNSIFDIGTYNSGNNEQSKARHEAARQRKQDCKHDSELAIMEIRDKLFKRINSNKLGVFEVDGRARSIARRYYYHYICNQIAAFSIFLAIAVILFAPFATILSLVGIVAIFALYFLSPSFYLQFRTPIGHEQSFVRYLTSKILFGTFQSNWMLYLAFVWLFSIGIVWFMPDKQLIPFSSDFKYIYYLWQFMAKQLNFAFDVGFEFKAVVFIVPLVLHLLLSLVWLISKGGNTQINLSNEIEELYEDSRNQKEDNSRASYNQDDTKQSNTMQSSSAGNHGSHYNAKTSQSSANEASGL